MEVLAAMVWTRFCLSMLIAVSACQRWPKPKAMESAAKGAGTVFEGLAGSK